MNSNEQKVLNHLKEGTLTTLQAVTLLQILNVQDCILRLRRKGHKIDKVWRTSANKKRFAVYFIAD